jgi:gliding motility-associated-like protein
MLYNKHITHGGNFSHPNLSGISLDSDENIVVSGNFYRDINIGSEAFFNDITPQLFVAKFTAEGDFVWAKQHDGVASSHTTDNAGNIYLTGKFGPSSSNFKSVLAKINPAGEIILVNPIEDADTHDISMGIDGYLYLSGRSAGYTQYESYLQPDFKREAFVLKISADGNFLGNVSATLSGTASMAHQSLVDPQGNVYTIGDFAGRVTFGCLSVSINNYSFFLVKHTNPPAAVDLAITGPTTEFCEASIITLHTNSVPDVGLYKWYLPPGAVPLSGTTETTEPSITLNFSPHTSKQSFVVSVAGNCADYFGNPYTITSSMKPETPLFDAMKTSVCAGTQQKFSVYRDAKVDQYDWLTPEGTTTQVSAEGNSIDLKFSQTFSRGTIIITAKNICGESSASLDIEVIPKPVKPILGEDVIVCPDITSFQRSIAPVANAIEYQWVLPSFIEPNPIFTDDEATLNAVIFPEFESGEIRVRAVGECQHGLFSDPITIRRSARPSAVVELSGPDQLCKDTDDYTTYQVPSVTNALEYIWMVPDIFTPNGKVITSTSSLQLKLQASGTGVLKVYGINGCQEKGDSVTIDIESFQQLKKPSLSKNNCENELIVTDATSPQWYKNSILVPNIVGLKMAVLDSGIYHVQVGNFCGVQESEPLQLNPVIVDNLFYPNVITPNGDGKNDFFQLDKSLKNSNIQIFNRWGSEIFAAKEYNNDWNGGNGSSGTYFFIITNECLPSSIQGPLTVIK